MKIRRFIAADVREAMRQVREALGPDAVILETQRVEGGIELSAAVDYTPAPVRPSAAVTAGVAGTAPAPVPAAPVAAAAATPADDTQLRGLRHEVRSLRDLLESELARLAWNDQVRRDAVTTAAMRNLARLGITADIVRRIVEGLGAELSAGRAWSAPLARLVSSIPACAEDPIAAGGVFAVVGPTGVGKTTTIAKLAARFALNARPEDVALVTTDTFRIAAREQLETFGEILGAPVYQAEDARRLDEVLSMLSGRRLVLIDTAGMGQRDVRLARQLSWVASASSRVRVLLALPANAQPAALREIVDAFMVARPRACILTKTDEATELGGALSALVRSELPLAYIANGQRVPEDLHFAHPRLAWLVKSALELVNRGNELNEDFMAEQFAEVSFHACA